LSIDGKEVVASYTFNVLVTSAAGLTQETLQVDLLQRLVGLKLPGFPRLFLLSIGKLAKLADLHSLQQKGVATQARLQLHCLGHLLVAFCGCGGCDV
jgi:hypothetical protein